MSDLYEYGNQPAIPGTRTQAGYDFIAQTIIGVYKSAFTYLAPSFLECSGVALSPKYYGVSPEDFLAKTELFSEQAVFISLEELSVEPWTAAGRNATYNYVSLYNIAFILPNYDPDTMKWVDNWMTRAMPVVMNSILFPGQTDVWKLIKSSTNTPTMWRDRYKLKDGGSVPGFTTSLKVKTPAKMFTPAAVKENELIIAATTAEQTP
jgi:hypothetical protein